MKRNKTFFLIFIIIIFAVSVRSQTTSLTPPTPPVLRDKNLDPPEYYIIGAIAGSIGGAKAVYLAKPVFPGEAKEAGAEGYVKVEIEVDEEGGVTSAKAVSGDQMLYETARNAALKSKFLTPKINGRREKIFGFLIYNFTIETPNWFKVGYDLALVEKVPIITFLQTVLIKKAFPADWQTANELLLKLDDFKRLYSRRIQPIFVPEKVDIFTDKKRIAQRIQGQLSIPQKTSEHLFVAQRLIAELRGRLANDPKSLWQFELGVSFIEFQETFRNPETRRESFEIFKRFAETVPADLQPEFSEQLKNLLNLPERKYPANSKIMTSSSGQNFLAEEQIEISRIILNLQKIK